MKHTFLPSHLQEPHSAHACQNALEHAADDTLHQETLHFLLCAAKALDADEALRLVSSGGHTNLETFPIRLQTILVPLLPPTSPEQAASWSQKYWPTIYKRSNPFGPHSSFVARAEHEIAPNVADYIALARSVGAETATALLGLPIGAVAVDRSNPAHPSIVVAAGDARWAGFPDTANHGSGNVMHHAVMRAIGLIAQKRKGLFKAAVLQDEHMVMKHNALADQPLTAIEDSLFGETTLATDGYLCLDLEIYVTHEPCVMCSMALLHSRFGRVVFAEQMPHTGGLKVEAVGSEASYGLFWRPELNWKLLAWQWVDDERCLPTLSSTQVHA